MNIIRVPECQPSEDPARWCESIKMRLGVPDWEGPISTSYDREHITFREFVAINGTVYQRIESRKDFLLDVFFRAVHISNDAPEILCPCGNTRFTLRYGSYEILARCPECGREEVVYDG